MKRLILPLILAGSFLLLYLLTLTQVHTYDALSYILDVDRKPWPELFHPHHLAYGPLGALIRAAATAFGWQGSAGVLLQAANALAGAAGVALFARVAETELRHTAAPAAWYRTLLAGLGAVLLGSAYAFWYYAVEVEVYTIAALFLIAALGLMLELTRRPGLALAVALGVVHGLAVLFHQTNVLLSVPALAALWYGTYQSSSSQFAVRSSGGRSQEAGDGVQGDERARPLVLLMAYGLPLALIVGAGYLGVGLGVSGFRTWGDLFGWAAGYATTGWWGGAVDQNKLVLLGQGLSHTIAAAGGGLIGLALLGLLGSHLRGLFTLPRATPAVLLSWLLVYGAFFLWWEPENIEFWIASLPPAILLVLLTITNAPTADWRPRWLAPTVLALLGVIMLVVNGGAIARRGDPTRDLQRVIAQATAAIAAPGDLIIAPDGLQELYLPYYEDRDQVFSLNQAMTASDLDWPAACGLLQERVATALASGYAVVLTADALFPPPAPPGEPPAPIERFGLTPEEVGACYEPFLAMAEPVSLGPGLPTAQRIPSAQEVADRAGWDFRRGAWGWRLTHATPISIGEPDGWVFTPAEDPFLSSPPLTIAPERYRTIAIRMAVTTTARDGQIFFLDANGQAAETRSIRFTLEPGPGAHTYELALDAALGWAGVITGLRLDPVGVGDGGAVTVEWIRLMP
jgi:hypothetical protein